MGAGRAPLGLRGGCHCGAVRGTGLRVLHGLIDFGCFVGWHKEGRAGRETQGQWGDEGQLCPLTRTLLGQPRTCLPKAFPSPGSGGDAGVALGCESVFGVSSQSPCSFSFQSPPRESDGKPREGQPCREDDCHGSQPVSTLLLPPPASCSRRFSSGHFLRDFALCSHPTRATATTPFPMDEVENSRQGLGRAGSWCWGLWECAVRGCRRFLGVSPHPKSTFSGEGCIALVCPSLPAPCKVNGAGFGGQSRESCSARRAFAAPRSTRKTGLGLDRCILPPARLGRVLAAPGRGGNAPGIKLESHQFYWGWSNVCSCLGYPESFFTPGWGRGDGGRRMLWGEKGCLVPAG